MANTKSSAQPVCLDLTRLISRVGRGPRTGIDRVELAYLRSLSERKENFFGLVRVKRDFYLLDRAGMQWLLARLAGGQSWGPRDLRSRLFGRRSVEWQQATSDLRRHAVGTSDRAKLTGMLQTSIGSGLTYINVGHSNIDRPVFSSVQAVPSSKIAVLLHDVIPLEFPQYQRHGSVARFDAKIAVVSEFADLVICPSADAQLKITGALARSGRAPPALVAHLGIEVAPPSQADLLGDLGLSRPYFVTVGTIEPRKNHELLLDIWNRLGPDAPTLCVVGQRGWNNEAVFARLDAPVPNVVELNDLPDDAITTLLMHSAGLLFPSRAEGFGLPPGEAAMIGIPVVCADLPVYREFLDDYPVYLDPADTLHWETTIRELSQQKSHENQADRSAKLRERLPSWDSHFNIVLKVL